MSTSSTVSSTVVRKDTAPLVLMAVTRAQALTLSGMSTMANTSVSPKAKYRHSSVPPIDLTSLSTTVRRPEAPSFTRPRAPSAE